MVCNIIVFFDEFTFNAVFCADVVYLIAFIAQLFYERDIGHDVAGASAACHDYFFHTKAPIVRAPHIFMRSALLVYAAFGKIVSAAIIAHVRRDVKEWAGAGAMLR